MLKNKKAKKNSILNSPLKKKFENESVSQSPAPRKNKKAKKNFVLNSPQKKFEDESESQSPAPLKKPSVKQLFAERNAATASLKRKRDPTPASSDTKEGKKMKTKRKEDEMTEEGLPREGMKKDFPRGAAKKDFLQGAEKKDFPRGAERQAQRQRKKEAKLRAKSDHQRLGHTLFVGNLPVSVTRKSLQKMFATFGIVESVRLRGAIPAKAHVPKKVADITRTFHEGVHSRMGFVVFKDSEGAEAALSLNGTLIDDHHIMVDRASGAGEKKMYDNKRTVFLGNLPFDVNDEAVWNASASFGEVEAVRVIRDKATGAGKGFGYVLFKEEASRTAAVAQETLEVEGRKIRIKSVEANKQKGTPKKNNNKGFGLSLKAKSRSTNPNSRKSTKKLLKREKAKHDKKKVADNFKKFF